MTCFEVRKEFPAFWRRTLPSLARANLVEHLHGCAQCDRAFRAFALSAPVVHSDLAADAAPSAPRPPRDLARPRRFTAPGAARPAALMLAGPRRPWKVAVAAAIFLALGGFAAWSSTRSGTPNFIQIIAGDSFEGDQVIYFPDSTTADALGPAEPSIFDSIAPDPSATDSNGVAGQNSL